VEGGASSCKSFSPTSRCRVRGPSHSASHLVGHSPRSKRRRKQPGIYSEHHTDFYCECAWTANKTGSGGKIDPTGCGYKPRKNKSRGRVLEWEHVVPAYYFGHQRPCWRKGHAKCEKADGTAFKGRACCATVDRTFKRIEADLHNLTPAVGELNGDRSNSHYGIVTGERRDYGACDFEIGGNPKVTEPRDNVRGPASVRPARRSGACHSSGSDSWREMKPESAFSLRRDT
jgi:endonuclease I